MRRRSFFAALPAVALAGDAFAQSQILAGPNPNRKRPDVHGGDRVDGATFASRSAAWGIHGAAATAHPLATQAAIAVLKKGGSAADAAGCTANAGRANSGAPATTCSRPASRCSRTMRRGK